MKLYRVYCEVDLMIVAEDRAAAERAAEYLIQVEDNGAEVSANANEVMNIKEIPPEWLGCLPFGRPKEEKPVEAWLPEAKP